MSKPGMANGQRKRNKRIFHWKGNVSTLAFLRRYFGRIRSFVKAENNRPKSSPKAVITRWQGGCFAYAPICFEWSDTNRRNPKITWCVFKSRGSRQAPRMGGVGREWVEWFGGKMVHIDSLIENLNIALGCNKISWYFDGCWGKR